MTAAILCVEVAYALPERQVLISVQLPAGSTAAAAIEASGVLAMFPEIDLAVNRIGIFSKPCAPTHLLEEGDRVEIYRSLQADPKDARRQKVAERRQSAPQKVRRRALPAKEDQFPQIGDAEEGGQQQ